MYYRLFLLPEDFNPFEQNKANIKNAEEHSIFDDCILESCTITEKGLGRLNLRWPLTMSWSLEKKSSLLEGIIRNRWVALARAIEKEQKVEIEELIFLGKFKTMTAIENVTDRTCDLRVEIAEIGHHLPPIITWPQHYLWLNAKTKTSDSREAFLQDPFYFTLFYNPLQQNNKFYFYGSQNVEVGYESVPYNVIIDFILKYTTYNINYLLENENYAFLTAPAFNLSPDDTMTTFLEKLNPAFSWTYKSMKNGDLIFVIFENNALESNDVLDIDPADASTIELQTNLVEEAHDALLLRGKRILHFFSLGTLGPTNFVRLREGWTEEEADFWVNPQKALWPYTINDIDEHIKTEGEADNLRAMLKEQGKMSDAQIEEAVAEYAKNKKDELLNNLTEARKNMRSVFQFYHWPGCDPTDLSLPGPAMLSCYRPGDLQQIKTWVNNLQSEAVACFPRVSFVAETAEDMVLTPAGVLKKEGNKTKVIPIEEVAEQIILTNKDEEIKPEISYSAGTEHTPNLWEMEFENRVPSLAIIGKPDYTISAAVGMLTTKELKLKWVEPRCFYRSFGSALKKEGSDEYYYDECWRSNDLQAAGCISFRFEFTKRGIQVDSPAPEMFACGEDYLFQIGYGNNANYDTEVYVPPGVNRYKPFDKGYALAKYDPDRVFYLTKTHWLRLVFQVAAYSAKRVELYVGNVAKAKNPKIIQDDYFFCEIVNPGFVWGLIDDTSIIPEDLQDLCIFKSTPSDSGNPKQPRVIVPYWNRQFLVIRHNIDAMASYFERLLSYYSRPRTTISWKRPLYSRSGNPLLFGSSGANNFVAIKIIGQKLRSSPNHNPSVVTEQHFDFAKDNASVTILTSMPPPPSYPRRQVHQMLRLER